MKLCKVLITLSDFTKNQLSLFQIWPVPLSSALEVQKIENRKKGSGNVNFVTLQSSRHLPEDLPGHIIVHFRSITFHQILICQKFLSSFDHNKCKSLAEGKDCGNKVNNSDKRQSKAQS